LTTNIRFPQGPIADATGMVTLEWGEWLLSPQFISIDLGAAVGVGSGGTGLTSGTSGGVLAFTATDTIASSGELQVHRLVLGGGAGGVPSTPVSLGTSTTLLHGNAGGAPTWGAVSLTADVTGVLTAANGGTGISGYVAGDLIYASAAGTLSRLADVATGNALISGGIGTAPSWGKVALTTHVSGVLPIANGGTNSGTALSGSSIAISNGSAIVQGAAGTTTTVLHGNAAGAPTYAAVSLTADVSGILPVANGGTGASSLGAALTKADDTNVTLTLGGSSATALVNAASISAGWAGTLSGSRGGTGVNNGTKTITLGGNVTTSGAFDVAFTLTAGTSVTLPASGTLATLAGSEALTNKTYNGNTFTAGTGTLTIAAGKTATHNATTTFAGTDGKTLTISNSLTLAGTDATVMTFPTTSATIARTDAANTFTGVQTMTSPAITTPAFTGAFSGTYSLGGTPTINVAAAVGGTWTAAATWTLPAHTLGGTVSGGGNQINNVIIGTSTPLAGAFTTLSATSSITASSTILAAAGAVGTPEIQFGGDTTSGFYRPGANIIAASISGTEAFRATAQGYFKASNAGTYDSATGSYHELVQNVAGTLVSLIKHTHATNPTGQQIIYGSAAPNDTGHLFIYCQDSGTERFSARSNGGVANFSANNVNLSDRRTKSSIELYTDEELDAFAAALDRVDWGRYKYADQTHDDWNHGPTAQGVAEAFAEVAPELVDEWSPGKSDLKAIYTHDLVYIALAALLHRVKKLEARA
jgi:hypothetical protein